MIAPRSLCSLPARRHTPAQSLLVAVAIAALVTRAFETPATPLALVRTLFSAAAIAFVWFAPFQSFARRAMVVLACEAIFGTIAFACIDVPFVMDHQRQIGMLALSIAERVDRFERTGLAR
ncbi:MAG: hypothetical protein NVS2B3_09340 [Vulcanimicrobiaceae bacterium]